MWFGSGDQNVFSRSQAFYEVNGVGHFLARLRETSDPVLLNGSCNKNREYT